MVLGSTVVTTGVGLLIVVVVFAVMPLVERMPPRILEHWAGDGWCGIRKCSVLVLEVLCGVAAVFTAFALLRRKCSFV